MFSVILECAGRPVRIHKRECARTHTCASGMLCHHTGKQRTKACSLHAKCEHNECCVSHSNCVSGTLKQKVPEHSMQCAQCSRQDHAFPLMLECIMVLCMWLECRQRKSWASRNAFYAMPGHMSMSHTNPTNGSQELRNTHFSGSLSTRITITKTCNCDKSCLAASLCWSTSVSQGTQPASG